MLTHGTVLVWWRLCPPVCYLQVNRTPLHRAARAGHTNFVRSCLKRGANPNTYDTVRLINCVRTSVDVCVWGLTRPSVCLTCLLVR